jgi:hypothetical protein
MFATACEGPGATDLLDVRPSFGTVDLTCLATLPGFTSGNKEGLLLEIHSLIAELFDTRQSENSAHSHIDNVGRKVCEGDYPAATKMAWSFFLQVDQQIAGQPAKQVQPYTTRFSQLMDKTFDLAWEPETGAPLTVPEGTFMATGGIGVVSTRKGGSVFTRNFAAAAVVDPGDYPAGEEVYIVLSRTPEGELAIPRFRQAYPAGYWMAGSQEPQDNPVDDGVLVQMCLEQPPANYGQFIQLGHDLGASNPPSELLDPEWIGLTIDCSGDGTVAASYPGASSSWLSSLTRWAGSSFRSVFTPAFLFAQTAGGVGLGGRTKSFSPFAPVDIYSSLGLTVEPTESTITVDETVQLTAPLDNPFELDLSGLGLEITWSSDNPGVATVDGDGIVRGISGGTAEVTAEFGPLPNGETLSATATITVLPLVELTVVVVNDADNAKDFRVFWSPSYGSSPTECRADPRTTRTCENVLFPATLQVTLEAEALWPDHLPNSTVPGFDVSITDKDGNPVDNLGAGCPSRQTGSGSATCVFTMPSQGFTIRFVQLNGGGG